ncbi:MAG: hypothetical protein ACI3XO_02765, partial [Eubacteriales bacterium]
LRAATRATRPRPRRLLKKAGENFHQKTDESPYFGLQSEQPGRKCARVAPVTGNLKMILL